MSAVAWSAAFGRVLRAEPASPRECAALMAVGAGLHGLVLGAFSGEPLMACYSALKVPLLLAVSTLVTLPNVYVVHGALGLHQHVGAALRGILAAQAALGLVLGALAPVLLVVAAGTRDGYWFTVLDGLLFALALAGAQVVLANHYRPLLRSDRRHYVTLWGWGLLYAFFAMQFAWVLRPFLGSPDLPVEFFRAEAFEQNAYLVVWDHLVTLWERR